MKKNYLIFKENFFRFTLLGLFCFLVAFTPKENENPKKKKTVAFTTKAFDPASYLALTVNGYNADVIANGLGALNTTTTNDVDGVNYCYLAIGTQVSGTATPTAYGLPTSGLLDVTNSDLFFQMASYSSNNSLRINQDGVAGQSTITFAEANSYEKIHLAVTSGSGASDVTFTVNFSDATTQVISNAAIPDWFNATTLPVVISGIGRGNLTNNNLENPANNPRIYQLDLNIDVANQGKVVTGITVQKNSGGVFNLFAATGKLVGTCAGPTNITSTAINSFDASVTWTPANASDTFEVAIVNSGNPIPATGTSSPTNSFNFTTLTSQTSYDVYVRTVCTPSGFSFWTGPFTFKTLCAEVTEFTENFDTYAAGSTTPMPDCWSKAGTGNTYINTGAVAPMSPANRLYMFASTTANPPTEGYAILPAVSNLQANTHRLKFKGFTTTAGRYVEIGYISDPTDISTYIQLQEFFLPSTVIANTQEFTFVPTGIPTGIKNLVIKNPGYPSSTSTVYIDDVAWEPIPACSNPTAVSATAVTSSDATINWTGNPTDVSWEIEYGAPGFTIGTGTIVPAATNPFTLSGLMPQTNYQYYVRAICAGSVTSTNSLPGSFLTACAPVSTFPWTENFDSLATVGTNNFPPCWFEENGDWASSNATTYNTANSGSNYIRDSWSATNEYIWTGGFSLVAGTSYDFSSFIQGDGFTGWTVDYLYNSAQSSTGATQLGATYAVPGTGTIAIQPYAKVTRTFVPTTSGVYYFAVRVNQPSGTPWYVAIDDFELKLTPTTLPNCSTNLVAVLNQCGNFETQLTWDANALATGYYITIGTSSGGTDIANNVDISNNSYSFVGQVNTQYFWTVVPYNGAGSASGCLEENFTTSTTGCYCTSLPTSNDDLGITNVQLGSTDFPNGDVTYFDHSATAVSLSQGINSNLQISFATGYTYNTYVWIDFNDNFVFDASELVYSGESLSTNPTVLNASFIMPATAALGTHKMRIATADEMTTGDPCYSGTYGVTLDFSITIIPAPACLPPSSLTTTNITSTSADLGWTETGTATVWDIEWGTSGFTPTGTPNIVGTTTNPHNLGTLTPNTAYSFYVRSDCGTTNGASTWAGPFSFTTACAATNVPYVMDFESATVPSLPNCTSIQNVGTGNLWTVADNPGYGFTTKVLQYLYSGTDAANVWFYTQGLNLTAGTTYAVAFDYGSNSTDYVEQLKVAYGTSANAAAMTNVVVDLTSISNNTPLNSSTQFTPATTGVYYFGFNVHSAANQYNLYVDNINIDVFLNTNSFDNSNFVAYPNPVKDVLNLSYSSEISSVKVINLLGQEVISRKVGSSSTQIDMTNLTAGAYIVNVTVGDVTKSIKVIKQ